MSNTMFFTLTDWGTIRKQNNLFEGLKKKKKKDGQLSNISKIPFYAPQEEARKTNLN